MFVTEIMNVETRKGNEASHAESAQAMRTTPVIRENEKEEMAPSGSLQSEQSGHHEVRSLKKLDGGEASAEEMPHEGGEREESGTVPKRCKKRMIIPPGWDVPISQTKVNIFDMDVCRKLDWELALACYREEDEDAELLSGSKVQKKVESAPQDAVPKAEAGVSKGEASSQTKLMENVRFANGKTALEIRADTWITQAEARARRSRKKKENAEEVKEPEVEMPAKPESWGADAYLHPDEQCPPKKRGRKPKSKAKKQEEEEEEKQDANTQKKSRKRGTKKDVEGNKKDEEEPKRKRTRKAAMQEGTT